MAPKGFNRYMLVLGMGTHPKFARLTDGEFRAHVVGVLAVAAMSPVRGCLLVGDLPAEAVDIAATAGIPEKVAASAMVKLLAVGVLRRDEEHNCLRVHDWDDVNPSPGAERTRRWRDSQASPERHTSVTPGVSNGRATVTDTSPEVKEKKKTPAKQENSNAELRSAVVEVFAYWQQRCGHPQATLSTDRRGKIEARLRERSKLGDGMPGAIADIRLAIDGAAAAPFIDDNGKRFDDIELVCRKGSKLEDFMGRAALPDRSGATVTPINRRPNASDLIRKLEETEEAS